MARCTCSGQCACFMTGDGSTSIVTGSGSSAFPFQVNAIQSQSSVPNAFYVKSTFPKNEDGVTRRIHFDQIVYMNGFYVTESATDFMRVREPPGGVTRDLLIGGTARLSNSHGGGLSNPQQTLSLMVSDTFPVTPCVTADNSEYLRQRNSVVGASLDVGTTSVSFSTTIKPSYYASLGGLFGEFFAVAVYGSAYAGADIQEASFWACEVA